MPSFEDELGQALRRAGDGFSTDQQQLADLGRTRGLRALRRRRAGAVTGGVAALALVGVGGAWAGGLLGAGGGATGQVAASGPATAPPRATAAAGGGTAGEKVTAAFMADTFRELLPGGTLTDVQAGGSGSAEGPKQSPPSASAVYDDGKGKAAMGISLGRVDPASDAASDQVACPSKAYVRFDACTSERLPDGARLMILQGYEYATGKVNTKSWRAVLLSREGYLVDASEWNAPAQKGAPDSRLNPPLDPAALKALVTDARWRTAAGRLAAPAPADDGVPGEPGAAKMSAILGALLPAGLKTRDRFSQPGFTSLVVNDGQGGGLVQVNAQRGMSEMTPGRATVLPDGTKVVVADSAGEKGVEGVVMRTVDTLRPDGRRVVLSAFNSDTQHTAPTRPHPVLTAEQLKSIALSPRWWK
ncbi:hypothetical protein ACIQM4_09620 [Streptomyces sp. NPDC091272]|uniref:hypothetical protein n=1 Tax=Streptomyces sp. NPDC091272 TaxID=3365981 RepID=UPI0037FCCE2F